MKPDIAVHKSSYYRVNGSTGPPSPTSNRNAGKGASIYEGGVANTATGGIRMETEFVLETQTVGSPESHHHGNTDDQSREKGEQLWV